jgi:hypothetical protein
MGGKRKGTWSMREKTTEGTKKMNSEKTKAVKRKRLVRSSSERTVFDVTTEKRLAISELEFDFDDSC